MRAVGDRTDELGTVFAACTSSDPQHRPSMGGVATLLLEVAEGSERWEVDREALTMVEKLGEGQFGDVMKMVTALFSDDGTVDFVAVKMLKSEALAGAPASKAAFAKAEADFLGEIDLMKRLRHPNLVALLGVCTRAPPLFAVIEFLKGGSLDLWLPENGHKLLEPAPTPLIYMLHQITLGCLALAGAGIVHRDLAARNVLVDDRLHVKVADYGLSRDVDEGKNYYRLATERPMPLRWTAPEAMATLTWTSAADCYSFGVVVFEMFTFGEFPFSDIESDADFIAVLRGSGPIHPLLLEQVAAALARHGAPVPPLVTELVVRCMVRDPGNRPTFDELAHLTRNSHLSVLGCVGGGGGGGSATSNIGRLDDTMGSAVETESQL
jgi:abelson tyrosine-protein kinase 1